MPSTRPLDIFSLSELRPTAAARLPRGSLAAEEINVEEVREEEVGGGRGGGGRVRRRREEEVVGGGGVGGGRWAEPLLSRVSSASLWKKTASRHWGKKMYSKKCTLLARLTLNANLRLLKKSKDTEHMQRNPTAPVLKALTAPTEHNWGREGHECSLPS